MSEPKGDAVTRLLKNLKLFEDGDKNINNIIIQNLTTEQKDMIKWLKSVTRQKTASKAIFIGIKTLQYIMEANNE